MKYYWELITKEGARLEIRPDQVDKIRKQRAEGVVKTNTLGDIASYQIQHFRPTSKIYNPQPLLEDAAQAFNEPVVREDGSILCRWVKKPVTYAEWAKHHGALPGYRKLKDAGGMMMVAFLLPVHVKLEDNVSIMSVDEIKSLTT